MVNARADAMLQPKLRNRAMEYMKRRLEPIVYQVIWPSCPTWLWTNQPIVGSYFSDARIMSLRCSLTCVQACITCCAQGPYVLCMVASGHQGDTSSKLPAMWLIRAYRSLSRPYKKNVKYIVLVRPSAMLSTMMVVLRPFLSTKAARKLHKVRRGLPTMSRMSNACLEVHMPGSNRPGVLGHFDFMAETVGTP